MFNHQSILITGGTGSLGKELTRTILLSCPEVKKIVVYSRDEQKHYQMERDFSIYPNHQKIEYRIGDIRDRERLVEVTKNIDYVIHTAAMKHIHLAEKNPMECFKTNIHGAENMIFASLQNKIKKVIAISTDKACAPNSVYGASKLASDKLFIAANQPNKTIFSVVRYGNVLFSNGSVFEIFNQAKKNGFVPITHPKMTRFNISVKQGIELIFYALKESWGGEIFVPKIPSYKITDIAQAIAPNIPIKLTGIRPGEKIHEEMIAEADAFYTYDLGKYFTILPAMPVWDLAEFITKFQAKKVEENFVYHSQKNTEWETVESIQKMIKEKIKESI